MCARIAIDSLLKPCGSDLNVQHIGVAQRTAGTRVAQILGQNRDRARAIKRCRRRKRQTIQRGIQTTDGSRDHNRAIGCSVAGGECQSDDRSQRHCAMRRCQSQSNRTAGCIRIRYLNRMDSRQHNWRVHRSHLSSRHNIHRRVVDCSDCNRRSLYGCTERTLASVGRRADFRSNSSACLIPGSEVKRGRCRILPVRNESNDIGRTQKQRRGFRNNCHIRPQESVCRELPNAIPTVQACDGYAFDRSSVHIRDAITTSRRDDGCNRLTAVACVIFGNSVQCHRAGIIKYRSVVDRSRVDGNLFRSRAEGCGSAGRTGVHFCAKRTRGLLPHAIVQSHRSAVLTIRREANQVDGSQ